MSMTLIIKSKSFEQLVANLKEVFLMLQQYKMKFNPSKCAFFIQGWKFLAYMVNTMGIEPNLEKVQAILNMPNLACVRDV